MPSFDTSNLGRIFYEPGAVVGFPEGLPGFEHRREFVIVQFAGTDPLVFLQSLEDPGLCFITLPVMAVDPRFRLGICADDLERLGLSPERQPSIGIDVLCLSVLSVREDGPTANLLAPVVVNPRNGRALQAVMPESGYSHQHVLIPAEVPACS